MDTPYLNAQISDLIDLEKDVQSPQNSLKAEHKVYNSMENNEQGVKFKHPSHFYAKYRRSAVYRVALILLEVSP